MERPATYSFHAHEDFEVESGEGFTRKRVVGEGSPVQLVADAAVEDLTIEAGSSFPRNLEGGRTLAFVAISGSGSVSGAGDPSSFEQGDFVVIQTPDATPLELGNIPQGEAESLRIVTVEVPSRVPYPLYPK